MRGFFRSTTLVWIVALSISTLLAACTGQQEALKEARKLLAEKKNKEAEGACAKILESEPQNPEAWNCVGYAKMQQGSVAPSVADFDKAIQFGKEHDSLAVFFFNRATARYILAEFDMAIADFQQCVERKHDLGNTFTYIGICQSMKGDDITAISSFNQALKADPENHFALSNRGYYNSKLGDNKQAVADFTKAISIKPDDKVSYLNRGYTYIGMGDYEAAIRDFSKALEIDPAYPGALTYMGIAYTNTNRPKEALPYLDKAIQYEPANIALYYYRGSARIFAGLVEEGCQDLNHALENGDAQGAALIAQYCR